jgi:hypothetical protein
LEADSLVRLISLALYSIEKERAIWTDSVILLGALILRHLGILSLAFG